MNKTQLVTAAKYHGAANQGKGTVAGFSLVPPQIAVKELGASSHVEMFYVSRTTNPERLATTEIRHFASFIAQRFSDDPALERILTFARISPCGAAFDSQFQGRQTMNPLVIILAGLYVLSPIDFLPDVIPVVGWLDDIGLLAYLGYTMMNPTKQP